MDQWVSSAGVGRSRAWSDDVAVPRLCQALLLVVLCRLLEICDASEGGGDAAIRGGGVFSLDSIVTYRMRRLFPVNVIVEMRRAPVLTSNLCEICKGGGGRWHGMCETRHELTVWCQESVGDLNRCSSGNFKLMELIDTDADLVPTCCRQDSHNRKFDPKNYVVS